MGSLVVPWKVHKTGKSAQKCTKCTLFQIKKIKELSEACMAGRHCVSQDPRFSFHKSNFDTGFYCCGRKQEQTLISKKIQTAVGNNNL